MTFRDGSGSTISVSSKGWDILHQGAKTDIIGDYDFRNRVYSPTLGRWLSNDPLGFDAGDVNTYRYLGNGPGNGLDPSGLERPNFLPSGKPGWFRDFGFQPAPIYIPKWEKNIQDMYELLDKCTKNSPQRVRYMAFLELDRFIETWRNTPSRQSFMGMDGNCWKFRDNLNGKLSRFDPNYFEYRNNENWQYWDTYFHRLYGGEGLGHAAVSITICGQKFYFDDGWWGYVFRPSDIPFYTLPMNP